MYALHIYKITEAATNLEVSDAGVAEKKAVAWEPPRWRQQLSNIERMRLTANAPVDSMGASSCQNCSASI